MTASWVWTGVVIYVIAGLAVAVAARRGLGKGMTDYFLANRTLGGFVAALTYSATTYSAFMMMGLAGLTYRGGVGAIGFELTYLAGIMLAIFFGPRFWVVGKKYGYISPSELLGDRYQNDAVAVVASIAALIFLIPYAAVQYMGIGYLLEGMSKGAIPFIWGLLIVIVLTIAWSLIAGLRSVAWTDALQALIMIVTSVLVFFFVLYKGFGGFGGWFSAMQSQIPGHLAVPGGPKFFTLQTWLNLTIPWFFFCLSNPQVSQRMFVPKDITAMKQMWGGFLIFGFIYTLISVSWGFQARLLAPGLKVPDQATPTVLAMADLVPPILALIVMIGIIAAAISTVDSILLTLSSMVARDIYGKARPKASEERMLLFGRLTIPAMAVVFMIFAYYRLGMITVLSSMASGGLLITVPAFFGAFFWKKATAAGALASMVIGGTLIGIGYITKLNILTVGPGVWGIILATAIFIVVSLFTKAPEEKANEFISYTKNALLDKNAL